MEVCGPALRYKEFVFDTVLVPRTVMIDLAAAEKLAEFAEHGGLPTAACDKAFAELIQIYHAQSSHAWVKPPISKRYKP